MGGVSGIICRLVSKSAKMGVLGICITAINSGYAIGLYTVEEACPAGLLFHSGFSCGNHQPKIFFVIPNVSAACCCLHQ